MKLGFIGLGIMGQPMVGHLLAAGHELFVHSRSGTPQGLTAQGAKACNSPTDVAQHADIIFLMVPDTPHVQDVLFGAQGVAQGLSPGKTIVDMSSISPIATLQVWPLPLSPIRVMFLPIRANKGWTLFNVASLPPTMMVRLAALAPTSPPETGASR